MGLVARVTAENGYPRTGTLLSEAGWVYDNKPTAATTNAEQLPALADILVVPYLQLLHHAHGPEEGSAIIHWFGGRAWQSELRTTIRRYAPASLALSAHHRAIWQLASVPFCPETFQILRSECHECGVTQRWRYANGIATCDQDVCSADLREDRPSSSLSRCATIWASMLASSAMIPMYVPLRDHSFLTRLRVWSRTTLPTWL